MDKTVFLGSEQGGTARSARPEKNGETIRIGVKGMDLDELKALKKKWWDEAVADDSTGLIAMVARTLGAKLGASYGPKFEWERDGVKIFRDDYGGYTTVHFQNKLVCSTHDCDRLFVPGPWMDVVRQAASEAKAKNERAEAARETALAAKLAAELGLTADQLRADN